MRFLPFPTKDDLLPFHVLPYSAVFVRPCVCGTVNVRGMCKHMRFGMGPQKVRRKTLFEVGPCTIWRFEMKSQIAP
jgi:hypothetical protein